MHDSRQSPESGALPCFCGRAVIFSAQHGAVGKGDGVAVKIYGAVVGEIGESTVSGERPGAAAVNGDDRVVADGFAALGIVRNIDGAGEAAPVFQGHGQSGNGIHHDVARKRLGVGGELYLRPVAAGAAPATAGAVACHPQEICVCVFILDRNAGEGQDTVGIGDVEHIAVLCRKLTAGHGEGGGAHVGVAAHGLVDHHVVNILVGTGALGVAHIAGDGAVFERNGVLSLNDQGLGIAGAEGSIFYGDVSGGVDGGRVVAV